jgi:hypothetical protein
MVRFKEILIAAWAVGVVVLLAANGGCGSKAQDSSNQQIGGQLGDDASMSGDDGSASSSGSGSSGGAVFVNPLTDAAAACSGGGLQCYVPPNCDTTITGTVYDPAGASPLYNVVVFVPNDPMGALTPIKQGTNTCSSCDVSIGDYVTATTSKADGTFTLTGVPATTHVPLVVQIGKWRREVFLAQVKSCTNNVLQGSSLTRLPRKRSEGDIPQMALVTGGADNLGCFLEEIGLDSSEYGAPGSGGRLDIYKGQGAGGLLGGGAPGLSSGGTAGDCTSDNAACVWNSKKNFEKYDIVMLSCEGNPYDPDDPDSNKTTNKSATAKTALHDWLDEGGKVFATHYHYTWFKNNPDPAFQAVATWLGSSGARGNGAPYDIDTSFPKGMVFSQWLGNVKALTGTQITLSNVADSVSTVNMATTQRWIYDGSNSETKYLSFVTPLGGIPLKSDDGGEMPPQYCGKAVFSDLHVGGSPAGDIPAACAGMTLDAQLKALEFLFFDLSACVANDSLPPPNVPPPAK